MGMPGWILIASDNDPLVAPIQFVSGETDFVLKPWTKTGLANFSGTAVYEKHFTLPRDWGIIVQCSISES
jgi:hypothetical protein